jgi:sugar lactone lactonase YvrE
MSVEVFDDTVCSLGEGPLWNQLRNSLLWFDIDNKVLCEKAIGGERKEYRFDRTVSAAGIVDFAKLIVASEYDLFVFDLDSREERSLCKLESDNPVTRSNDGRADPYGGFWIGTMGYNAEANAGAIYRFYRGELRLLFPEITISNSICSAPCRRKVYFTDSVEKIIKRVAVDNEGWPVGEPDDFIDLSGESFAPDGAICDAAGRLWSAQWGAKRVAVYSDQGELLETYPLPASQATCPAFGGPDLSTLYVTTAGSHLPDELQGSEPRAGNVFAIRGLGPGQAPFQVIV